MPPLSATIDLQQGATDTQMVTVTGPLSVNGVASRRLKAPKMPSGVAPHTSSEIFKSSSSGKPKAKRWDSHLTQESKSRKPSSLKGAAKYLANPGLISLGGGLPSCEYFPFEKVEAKVPSPPHFSEAETAESGTSVGAGKYDIAEGKSLYDLHVALNYGQGTGSPQILRFVTEHTEIVHNPPYHDWNCTMTIGNTSAVDMAYRMFTSRGDFILAEEYTFATAIETGAPLGVRAVAVKMDAEGILPSHVDELLSGWDAVTRGAPKPRLLYTVPSGQNPTGATQSAQRRRGLYSCAQKHDIYILEDDPYYFLQMQPYAGADSALVQPPASHAEFLAALVPSLLSMDVDGRVMRMDSFSKVLAPGTRIGWITASEQVVERFVRHTEVSTQFPSGFTQILLFKLLDETWGHEGYLSWLINLRMEYTKRRDVILGACERYLPREVASWNPPMAGMFHWIKVDHTRHPSSRIPSAPALPLLEIEEEVFQAAIARGVLVTKGSWFRAAADAGEELFFRTTFAAASSEKIDEAIKRFGEALRAVFELGEDGNESERRA